MRYVGDPVAGVAAISPEIAQKALDLIDVEYEVLEPVLDPELGTRPDAALLHPDLGQYVVANFIFPKPGTNISNHFKIRKGDVDGAWGQCAAIVERKYRIPHIQHVPIEPHVAVAQVEESGEITLWGSSQSPFAQRNLIAQSMGISQSRMRVIAPLVGGGFGSKAGVSMEALVVAIATKVHGRPVKLLLTREEEFYTAFVRQGLVAHFKMGCDAKGRLLAMENVFYWDGGAYTEYGVNVTRASGYSSSGPYEVPNIKTDSYCVYTNHPVGGPMRGFGMPEMHAGLEQCIDELALQVGMDAVEFRRLNCLKTGSTLVTGSKMHPTGLPVCIEKTAEAIGWGKKAPPSAPNKRRGKGLALMWKAPAMPPNAGSSAWVELAEDGTVTVGVGGPGNRAGGLHRGRPDGRRRPGRPVRVRPRRHAGRYALQPLRMADRRQPPHLEHGQCHRQRRPRRQTSDPGYGGRGLGRNSRRPGDRPGRGDLVQEREGDPPQEPRHLRPAQAE